MDLVVGATGHLGSAIAHGLLARGRDVRILVRPGSDASTLVEAGAQPVEGDLKDPVSLARACDGIDVVVTTANSATRGGDDTPDTVEIAGNRALIDAAAAAGVRQFVFVSALGSSEDSPAPFLRGKAIAERHLRESGMHWTILTPPAFMEVWVPMLVGAAVDSGRPVMLVGSGMRRHSMVSMRDVAAFAIAAVDHPAALDRTLVTGGPEPLTWIDITHRYAAARGKPVDILHVQPGEPLPGLPPAIAGIAASFDTYDAVLDMDELWATFGVEPTKLEHAVGLRIPA